MSQPTSTSDAIRLATESVNPVELADLYNRFEDNAPVVKAIVNNRYCPDEVKKRYVVYAIDNRLRTYASRLGPSGDEILDAIRSSLSAWQPVQRLAPTPELDMSDPAVAELLEVAGKRGAIILYGPPGTSKTYLARGLAAALGDRERHRNEFVQFHPSYSYEDFLEGIVPEAKKGAIVYSVQPKVFKEFCLRAEQQGSQRFVFVIDEINRADLSKVFGEVLTALEYRGQPVHLLYSPDPFRIPSNVLIIGTMNTIDRTTYDVDYALSRRFFFFEVQPTVKALGQVLAAGDEPIDEGFRERLLEAYGKVLPIYPLGHAYFKDVRTADDLRMLWEHQLKRLLQQYFEFESQKVRDVENLLSPLWEPEAVA